MLADHILRTGLFALGAAALGLFFPGGIGRVLAFLAVGAPHPLFTVLMGVELALPVLLAALTYAARAR